MTQIEIQLNALDSHERIAYKKYLFNQIENPINKMEVDRYMRVINFINNLESSN